MAAIIRELNGRWTTDSEVRAFGVIRETMLLGGWRLAKTNIADWSVVTNPATNTDLGYEIFGSNDAGSLDEYFVKFVYNKPAGSTGRFVISVQTGYGFDNSTGVINLLPSETYIFNSTDDSSPEGYNYPAKSYFCAYQGGFCFNILPVLLFGVNVYFKGVVVSCERIKNGTTFKNAIGTKFITSHVSTTEDSGLNTSSYSQYTNKDEDLVYTAFRQNATSGYTVPMLDILGFLSDTQHLNRLPVGLSFVQSYKLEKLDNIYYAHKNFVSPGSFVFITIDGVDRKFIVGTRVWNNILNVTGSFPNVNLNELYVLTRFE